jgi:5-methylthioadenosine/S-adenosylhomocysteine deaminase
VHLDNAEIELLARSGAYLAHCPSSNLKLASGLPQIARMLEHGVNIGLGTDGAASNNRLDLFQEMRLAALLAKGNSGKADALPAAKALTAATLGGARALGLESRLGSLLPGKAADLCAVRFDQAGLLPCYDPISHLVYAAGREYVSHVWVGGACQVREGRVVTLNEHNLYSRIRLWQNKLVLET